MTLGEPFWRSGFLKGEQVSGRGRLAQSTALRLIHGTHNIAEFHFCASQRWGHVKWIFHRYILMYNKKRYGPKYDHKPGLPIFLTRP